MADLVPNTFSNLAHEYVYKTKTKNSLFFVKASVVPFCTSQVLDHLMNKLQMTEEEANELISKHTTSTGFVVSEDETTYYVLTCAHLLEGFYSARTQIMLAQIKFWFQVLVACQHFEENVANNLPHLYADPNVDPRVYSPAAVSRFDQNKDLMLLIVSKNHLYSDNHQARCEMPHPAIRIARFISPPLSDVTMVSWPPLRKDTPVIGRMISQSRVYGQITSDLSKGYDMHLLELDITGDDGSSGAPVLNHNGHMVCVYHGRLNSVGHGISAGDVHEFLQGVI